MFKHKLFNLLFIFLSTFSLGISLIYFLEKDISNLLFSSKLDTFVSVSMYFFYTFAILRLRDYLINTKFPKDLINSQPLAASIYYSASIVAVFIGTAMIIS